VSKPESVKSEEPEIANFKEYTPDEVIFEEFLAQV